MSKRSSYTIAERAKLVRRVQQKVRLGGKTVSQACREVGIFDSQYYRWLKNGHGQPIPAAQITPEPAPTPPPKIDQARREVEQSARDHAAFVAGLAPTIPASTLQAENDYLWGVVRALARQGSVKIVVNAGSKP